MAQRAVEKVLNRAYPGAHLGTVRVRPVTIATRPISSKKPVKANPPRSYKRPCLRSFRGLPSISLYPDHHTSAGYDLAVRTFKAINLSAVVAIDISRLAKSGLLAWIRPRRPVLIQMVSV